MASKLTWQDFYKSLRLEKDVAGEEGVTGRIAGDGSYDGPLATKYKKKLPDFESVKAGKNYPGNAVKVPNQAHPDDEDALGMMAAPEVDSFAPHAIEKISKMRSVGKFAEATKNLSNKEFIRVILEANKGQPALKTISDLHGNKITPQPSEVIPYIVSLCHNSNILGRLVGELKKQGYMETLVRELVDRSDFYDCIVKCMDHHEEGPKIANRIAKSMADHHMAVVKNTDITEAVSPALEDDFPPEDDDNQLNAAPQDGEQGQEGDAPPEGEEGEEENGEDEDGQEGEDGEGGEHDEKGRKHKKHHGDGEEDNGEGEEEGHDLELSDEDSLPDDNDPNMAKESVHHKKKKRKGKRKLPHHHMMDALRPYFGGFGIPLGIGVSHHGNHDVDCDHDGGPMPGISMSGGMPGGGMESGGSI